MTHDEKQAALAAIEGLAIGDVLQFFYDRATDRDKEIADKLAVNDELNCDGAITSEGEDNGSWVLTWSWVDFTGTSLDKGDEDEEEDAGAAI